MSRQQRILKAAIAVVIASASGMASANPGQFVAKMYTEALGRAPDSSGWTGNMNYLNANGCSKASLKVVAQSIYGSGEYTGKNYDNAEKTLTAFRGILNREPDASGFNYWSQYLSNGNSLNSMIDFLFESIDNGEISSAKICAPRSYDWGSTPVADNSIIPIKGAGISTLSGLKAALASAQPGSTVYLAQRAVIVISSQFDQIVIPAGVTLATSGLPGRREYARQARIVRNFMPPAQADNEVLNTVVQVSPGAHLKSVWVTGQRQILGNHPAATNVYLVSGNGTSIENSRVENSAGWTGVVVHRLDKACTNVLADNNLVTGYSNTHNVTSARSYTDGISGTCEGANYTNNDIVDPSDVGIVIFTSGTTVNQASKASGNTVISAGVPAYAAMAMDPLSKNKGVPGDSGFNGASFTNNKFWAAPDSHFDIGLAVGTRAWHFDNDGIGGSFTSNSTAGIATPMQIGILLEGMKKATVLNNSVNRSAPAGFEFSCPQGDFLADLSPANNHGYDSNYQLPVQNVSISGCINPHSAP